MATDRVLRGMVRPLESEAGTRIVTPSCSPCRRGRGGRCPTRRAEGFGLAAVVSVGHVVVAVGVGSVGIRHTRLNGAEGWEIGDSSATVSGHVGRNRYPV